jgi:hypothetical protein
VKAEVAPGNEGIPNDGLARADLQAVFGIVDEVERPVQLAIGSWRRTVHELLGLTSHHLRLRRGGPTERHRQCRE